MALINCPECGKEISDRAHQCPNCGFWLIENEEVSHKKKESVLSVFSLILHIFSLIFLYNNIFFVILYIVSIVMAFACFLKREKFVCAIIVFVLFMWKVVMGF